MSSIQIDPKLKIKKIEDLIDLPVVVHVNEFNEKSAKDFRDAFAKALNTGQKVVPVVIDSYGGQVYSLMSMAATIKASPVPVATICTGKAMSCGALLLSCGTEGYRFMDSFATVLIHDVSSGSFGKVEEIKADAKEVDRLNQFVYRMMARNVGKPEDYFLRLVHDHAHADWYLSSEECLSHNIINYIRVPNFKIKVQSEIVFE